MSSDSLTNPTPQFGKAEYANTGGPDRCQSCKQPFASQYYRINGALACASCAEQLQQRLPKDSHSIFVRGLLFGIGGAIAGLILYAGFTILTGLEIGYVALAVGWIVGKAIMKGSNGVGGRRYQVAAVLLTYAAVSIAAIPIGISVYLKQQKEQPAHSAKQGGAPDSQADRTGAANPAGTDDTGSLDANPSGAEHTSPAALLGMLLLQGLASPFLGLQDGIHGIIGLIILSVGIRIAWSMTAAPPLEIIGPFAQSPSPAGSGS